MVIELELLLTKINKEEKETNQEYLSLNNALEVETKTTIERGLVMGIITLLDMVSIAL